MLDEFMSVVASNDQKKQASRELVDALKNLSEEELLGLANGTPSEEMKLAFAATDESNWLAKYKGTPLFEEAAALEEQLLQVEMADLARRQENQHNKIWDLRDRICLQRRMLDLQLTLSQQNQISSGPEEMLAEQAQAEQAQKEAAAKSKIARALKNYINTVSGVRVNRLNKEASALPAELKKLSEALARNDFEKKEANVGAVLSAGKNILGKAKPMISASANRVGKAYQQGGLVSGAKALGQEGAQFARRNPLTAAGLAAGAGFAAGSAL